MRSPYSDCMRVCVVMSALTIIDFFFFFLVCFMFIHGNLYAINLKLWGSSGKVRLTITKGIVTVPVTGPCSRS